jgi:hypothetical protein
MPPGGRARNADGTQHTCGGQARRQDEGERGPVGHEDAQPVSARAHAAWGRWALPDRSSDHRLDPWRREPRRRSTVRRARVGLSPPGPQAQDPTGAEPDPPGRRQRNQWEGRRGPGPAGTPPTSARSAGAPAQAAPAQHVRDRGGRDGDPELEELAFNPQVAPPWVLSAHAKDQLAQLGIDGGTPRAAAPPPVPSVLELATPALERLGHHPES